jgi:hypothetical protein
MGRCSYDPSHCGRLGVLLPQSLLRTNEGSTRLCEQKHCLAILFADSSNVAYA